MTNKYIYEYKGKRIRIKLPVGEKSRTSEIKTELIFTNFSPDIYRGMSFIADENGSSTMPFFSTRGAYKLTDSMFPYIEVKGCGIPNRGILNKYFLEDGRDKDEIQDPIGGFSLNKAIIEWKMLEKLRTEGVQTHIPIALLKIKEIKGPRGEDLALLIRSGRSNIRLSYLEGIVLENMENIRDDALYSVGKNLSLMHHRLNLCHNALHEENITLNGEIVDLEYASSSTEEGIYRDIWYALLSFAEIFGTPLDTSKFVEGYTNRRRDFIVYGKNMREMEKSSKITAENILNIQR